MEKRIKALHWFTIAVIIAFCSLQCYWLYYRYKDALNDYEEHLYHTVLDVIQEDYEMRRATPDPNISILTHWNIKMSSDTCHVNTTTTTFDVYIVNRNKYMIKDSIEPDNIANIYERQMPDGIAKYTFEIDDNRNKENDVYDALERFKVNACHSFRIAAIDSLLTRRGIKVKRTDIGQSDSMIWTPTRTVHPSILKNEMTISYPYDILDGKIIHVTLAFGLSPIIMKMLNTLIVSLILSFLLIVCLIAQIATIRKQRKIEELRRDFIHTMIHELKRPVSTLKMCISYMRNEKLMQDREGRESIISDACNELDNLSSYFSKMRDLTFIDVVEISLSLSAFNLHEMIEECIRKLSIPGEKDVSISIVSDTKVMLTADKIHIANVINNLLENAIKYSGNKVAIEVSYDENEDESITISVKDNGFGIPKSECKYVFDKFFRSHSIVNKDIPGMGLGLSYVKLLVSAHKGSVEIHSEEGTGTVVTIKLPQ